MNEKSGAARSRIGEGGWDSILLAQAPKPWREWLERQRMYE